MKANYDYIDVNVDILTRQWNLQYDISSVMATVVWARGRFTNGWRNSKENGRIVMRRAAAIDCNTCWD